MKIILEDVSASKSSILTAYYDGALPLLGDTILYNNTMWKVVFKKQAISLEKRSSITNLRGTRKWVVQVRQL